MDTKQESLSLHREWAGKIEVTSRGPVGNSHDLSVAYTPGVAEPCREIHADPAGDLNLTRPLSVQRKRFLLSVHVQALPFSPFSPMSVSYTHLRAHETDSYLVCR